MAAMATGAGLRLLLLLLLLLLGVVVDSAWGQVAPGDEIGVVGEGDGVEEKFHRCAELLRLR